MGQRVDLRALAEMCEFQKVIFRVCNRPLPSFKTPHFHYEAKCTTFLVKVIFFMRMKLKIISISKAEH